MRVLSLFDGMSCGMIAMIMSNVQVDEYIAYEIDKYAIQTSKHNFPIIQQNGDVFDADFTKHQGVDWLVGGSPCTYWSIAQTKNRETTASGLGWELFSQYVRALYESKPKYFIYENNKSMSKDIKASITETFGFEPIWINSALVSAQNRNRYYWCGIRQTDGTYRQANVEQPEDLGILLKDILISGVPVITTSDEKSHSVTSNYYKDPSIYGDYTAHNIEKKVKPMVAEKIKPLTEKEMDYMVRDTKGFNGSNWNFLNVPSQSGKSLAVLANFSKGVPYNICAEPINITEDGKSQTIKSQYYKNSVSNFFGYTSTYGATGVAEPIEYLSEDSVKVLMRPFGSKGKISTADEKTHALLANSGGAILFIMLNILQSYLMAQLQTSIK